MKHAAECLQRAEASLKIASSCPEQGRRKWLAIAHNWLVLARLTHERLAEEAARQPRPDDAPRPVSH